jgi:hypothetical protein
MEAADPGAIVTRVSVHTVGIEEVAAEQLQHESLVVR